MVEVDGKKKWIWLAYLSRLSRAQWGWLGGSLAVCIAIVAIGWAFEPANNGSRASFTTSMSIRDIAPKLGVTGKALARGLGLPLDVPKRKPLGKLGITQQALDHEVAHLRSHQSGNLKYYVFAALSLWGLVFLTRLGRPDHASQAERRIWYPRAFYVASLLVAVAVCGFALGKSPNPMEGAVKVFKSMVGLYPSVWEKVVALAFFLLLAVVGNKLICGWACPFGALQELLYSLPFFRRIKRRKIPFLLSNAIRGALFLTMLLLLFGVMGPGKGFVVYHSMNPFNLFSFDFDNVWIVMTIVAAVLLAFAIYRPFCLFICPFGLISWLVEKASLARVEIDETRCNQCGACIQACPLEAARNRVTGNMLSADCFSCARCLNVCPKEAISYRFVFTDPSKNNAATAPAVPEKDGV